MPRQVFDIGERFQERHGRLASLQQDRLQPVKTIRKQTIALAATLIASAGLNTFALAEDAPAQSEPATQTAASGSSEGITLELNKLEKSEKGCRAYVVVSNPTQTTYDAFKLDLVLFQTDGIIGRRFALDLAPVRPDKSTVKLFDLDGTTCETIGKFLVNDVMECRASGAPVQDCLARLKVKSLTKAEISK